MDLKTQRVLIISYLFPPMGGIAVQRALSMAKYLPSCGFDVHVLRAVNAAAPVYDPGLLQHLPKQVKVHSALTLEVPFRLRHWIWSVLDRKKTDRKEKSAGPALPGQGKSATRRSLPMRIAQHLLCPEPEVLWVPFATRAARAIIRKHKIDCVIVTAPPFSAFLIGNALKATFPGLKYVADFRDEWLTFYINNNEFQNNPRTRRRAARIERETVEAADLVIAVTESSLEEMAGRYPEQPHGKFHCISNGFDPEAFSNYRSRAHGGPDILVTHVGTVYKNASPSYYFEALKLLPPEIRRAFRTRFIGRLVESERAALEAEGESVQVIGFLPQTEALLYMEDTDFLLLTMTDPISMPGKMYEYLATGKPILAIASPGSEVDRILKKTNAGWCADPSCPAGVAAMLTRAYEMARRPAALQHEARSRSREYERPVLVKRYGALISQVVDAGLTHPVGELAR